MRGITGQGGEARRRSSAPNREATDWTSAVLFDFLPSDRACDITSHVHVVYTGAALVGAVRRSNR
jgi:hypothetical protein